MNIVPGQRVKSGRLVARVVRHVHARHTRPDAAPLRGELFGLEQLARHAKALAGEHRIVTFRGSNSLLARLDENEQILKAFNRGTLAVGEVRTVTPAAEWLLDNFYLIEEQIQTARRHLPRSYSRELPRLASGPSAGLPRVYDIVLELITHVDAQVDAEPLREFVAAYQSVCPLKLGELWAVPIMLRLALIENLRRVTTRGMVAREERNLANLWASRLQQMSTENPSHLVVVVADMAKSELPLTSPFITEFCKKLSSQNQVLHLARTWIEQRLANEGLSLDPLVQQESQTQAADQVSVSHSITSLRMLSAKDWREFVETSSLVEQTLRGDPAGVYSTMDFSTRDKYRHSVETISRHCHLDEVEVAQKALKLAQVSAVNKGVKARTAHIGYFLVDKGRPSLESMVDVRSNWTARVNQILLRYPMAFYGGGILFLTMLSALFLSREAYGMKIAGWPLVFCSALFVLASSQLAVSVMNWLTTLLAQPHLLPRLDFSTGIPPDSRTMVVVPTLLSSQSGIEHLLEVIEIHYLSNRDRNLFFALLTDFEDANQESMPNDEALLEAVRAGINMLNKKYEVDRPDIFFLFHRPRRWNPGEGVWMGYERKRGKLTEFNAFLRGGAREAFCEIIGDCSILPTVRFVITLDTDTQLPRDTARELVGTLAHPLNRPQFDEKRGTCIDGYSILQPRVCVSLPSAGQSWFVRIFAGDVGIDPYTRAASDVYQDLFQEGSFIGKGIYDVDAFEQALAGRFPENKILSHDLIESCYARAGLVSDIQLYEEYPSRYNTESSRRHRWVRGDWQIAQWILTRVPCSKVRRAPNPLSVLSKWKIFDNLRRSLIAPALLLLIVINWILIPQLAWLGSFLVLSIICLPSLLATTVEAVRKPKDLPPGMHLKKVASSAGRQFVQASLSLIFLPYEAFMYADAIVRTISRLLVTRKGLLQWQTARAAERTLRMDPVGFYLNMWIGPAVSLVTLALLLAKNSHPTPLGMAIAALWLLSPWIAWLISQPIQPAAPELSSRQLDFLRRTARRTWHFFETFVTAEDNWLPPDNYQEEPLAVLASRTSPTNMGLALLANLTAYDFGYLPVSRLIKRTEDAFATMQRMERHRGHFYNWYNTRTLEPLPPLYVSSVDSGNLAGHLLILGSGFTELCDHPVLPPQVFTGLRDAFGIMTESSQPNTDFKSLREDLANPPETLTARFEFLRTIMKRCAEVSANQREQNGSWIAIVEQQCREQSEDLLYLAPWLALAEKVSSPLKSGRPGGNGRDKNNAGFDAIQEKLAHLRDSPTLREISQLDQSLCPLLEEALQTNSDQHDREAFAQWLHYTREGSEHASQRISVLETLARQCAELANMDFTFLYDQERELFSIGYNVSENRRDGSYYDLLASEARLCGYIAIAQDQIPQEHWFTLGRLLVAHRGQPLLASWNGSLFEYLMPLLVMPNYERTLLDQTYHAVVEAQIDYGHLRGVPWGISESGYNRTDAHLNYQYRGFGVPGLGLKRGLAEDLVIAPYATLMALMVAPRKACDNLERLNAEGRAGTYGFYEAIDYTPSRLPRGQSSATIRSFMGHHQGMGLLALAYVLLERPMQRRFMSCPLLKACDLLLQERVPNTAAEVLSEDFELDHSHKFSDGAEGVMRVFNNPGLPQPEVHLLSNGRYHVVVSSAGGGYSRWRDLAVTRWREDATRDCWGTFVYVRDVEAGDFWSAAYQPTLRSSKDYEAIFTQGRAEYRHRHAGLEMHTEICVSPEDDIELRRITLINRSHTRRTIELTSYAEVVLADAAGEAAHPAFSNLFVQTELVDEPRAILCSRRSRSEADKPPWLLNLMIGQGGEQGETSCETDRSRFVGRGNSLLHPAAMQTPGPLSGTVGSVLDPVLSLRRTVTLAPDQTARIDLIQGVTDTREAALGLVEKYHNPRMADRALELSWTHSQVTLRHLNASEAEAQLYARLASALIYANQARRATASMLFNNRRGQSGLWSYGISGDVPIVLLRISDPSKLDLVQQLIQAHAYWRMKGLPVDLVILNEDVSVYRQSLYDGIINLISSGIEAQMLDKPGGLFVRRLEQVSPEDRVLLQSVARLVLLDENGTLSEQLERPAAPQTPVPALKPIRSPALVPQPQLPARELIFNNGWGGFTPDGREYVITLMPNQMTPAPWVNVMANPYFGTVVSESGSAYTWVENCHEFRLTPWHNDPVCDPSGECFYIRDEHTGQVWSPTPLPARGLTPYVIRHGFGYSVFEHTEHGIFSELTIYVATNAPVKFAVLKLRNVSGRARQLSVTGYYEWVLGDLRQKTLLHIVTELDSKSGALLARNHYQGEFAERIAYIDVNDPMATCTGDRREFIGRNGSPAFPSSLKRTRLSGKTGAGLDPCGAVQVPLELPSGSEREVRFRLGVGRNPAEVQHLIQRFRRSNACREALESVWQFWNHTLGVLHFETPDDSVNVLANGWLLYQTLSCRVWGRTGFYQSGGAYGFRDQLQDVMALVHARPSLTREQILRAASRQFREGDVQHWWHPPTGRGVRTHFSDDYLWLPYVVSHYVNSLEDTGILDEKLFFLDGRAVKPEEESYYDLPNRSEESGTLYEHCVRAIEHGLHFGDHGLPLIGCGDWNDGFNLIGAEGRGESVWLAFFLFDVLKRFSQLARQRGDSAFAERCSAQAEQLRQQIKVHAWDGKWYRRAYFDNGEPLGSSSNAECQIDSLSQSWSVLAGASDRERSRQAMEAVEQRLVRRDAGLIQLFDPPFANSHLNPGYVKGYVPGVRENGGQYTHAAVWTVMAFAELGEHELAWELFHILNPVNHGSTRSKAAIYKVEPYVIAADVYSVSPHVGRGGWTWYTGSAGWMYRLLTETMLGVKLEGETLRVEPRMPKSWPGFKIHYRFRETIYHISVVKSDEALLQGVQISESGRVWEGTTIPLVDDHQEHHVQVRINTKPRATKPAPSAQPGEPSVTISR